MDQELAKIYGTPGALSDEDQEKVAEAELFVKLASDEGIDLSKMTDEQVVDLYNSTFQKEAQDEKCPKCENVKGECKCPPAAKKEEPPSKEAAAQAEFAQVQEWQEKCAEADKLGRIMAHSYVQELGKIGAAVEAQQGGDDKGGDAGEAGETKDDKGAGQETPDKEDNEASALDQQAAEKAVEKAGEAGYNTDEAIARINAVFTLGGPGESEKIASAQNYEQAVDTRALEILEKAGYEVKWGEEK